MIRPLIASCMAACVAVLALCTSGYALDEVINRRITYQGQLSNPSGVTQLTFKLYNGQGQQVWGPETLLIQPDSTTGNFVAVIGSTGLDQCSRSKQVCEDSQQSCTTSND